MELDFKTIKALSSPTRVSILRQVLEKEATPTNLSRDLEKSKSTISSHLSQLVDAGLVEKEAVEGRKRVTYSPTRKARAIVKGHERKVKFSIASSVIGSYIGVAILGRMFLRDIGGAVTEYSAQAAQDQAGIMEQGAPEAGARAAETASSAGPETAFLFLGTGLLLFSALSLGYGLLIQKLSV